MLVGCWLGLAIQWYAGFTSAGHPTKELKISGHVSMYHIWLDGAATFVTFPHSLDHFSRIYQLYSGPHAPCAMPYVQAVHLLIGC